MPFYRLLRMGCGVSKIDANGVATPNRSILPNFHTRKNKQSTKCIPNSKKEPLLMMPENDDRPSISAPKSRDVNNNLNNYCVITSESAYKEENDEKRVAKIKTIVEEAERNDELEEKEDDDNDNDDDQRAINKVHENGNAFPGSPSFRVYFTDKDVETKKNNDGYNKVGLKDVTPIAATTISPTKELEYSSVGKDEEKKEIRKRSTFRKLLPRNLLNVRSSSNSSSTRSNTHRYHHKVAS